MLDIEERITKAKIWLLTKRPWFGQLSCYLNIIENKFIKTAGIDLRGNLYYNPTWCNGLNDKQLRGLLCHEVLHLALQHIPRCGERDKNLWNIAADLKVNIEIINDQNMELPPNALKPNKYGQGYTFDGGKIDNVYEATAENCYTIIRKHMKIPPQSDQDLIIATDDPKEKKKLEKAGIKPISQGQAAGLGRDWQSRVYSASQMAKGDLPAGVARELFKLEHSELPWGTIIKQRLRKIAIKHSWKKPSKRYLPWYFPGRSKNEGVKIVAVIDTSGSMSKEQITKAISELYGLMRTFTFMELWVTDCDAAVYNAKKVKMHELSKLLLSGGGGTDFKPAFNWTKEELKDDIDCLLFFTDLYGDFPSKKPPYETFWITDTKDINVPFGRRLLLKSDED
jgi:predicted metal-dependent peptidase